MQQKLRVFIIAHFCDYGQEQTNNRFNYLAELLARKGVDVELITSSFSHRDKLQRNKDDASSSLYKTTLIYEPSYQKNVSLKRLLVSHPVMARNLRKYLEGCAKPDMIYCAIPSADVAEQAANYAKKHKIPFILDVQDLWPEAYRFVFKNNAIYTAAAWPMKIRANNIYAAADQIVAVSDTYARRANSVNKKCKKTVTVYLGTDAAAFDWCVKENTPPYSKPDTQFWVGYCGTLGHSYDLNTVMMAMRVLADRGVKNLHLMVIGSGPLEEYFKTKAAQLGISCTFTGKLPYGQMCAQLVQCDIAVNPIAAGAAQSIINKHADYAIAGLPVISTQENEEYRNLLVEYNCGINCEPGDVLQVADAICTLAKNQELCLAMGKNARKMGLEKFDRGESYSKIVEALPFVGV